MTIHVICGDAHFGAKNGDKRMLDHQMSFFYDQLIPFCEANSIKSIIFTGDLFDNRKTSNNYVIDAVQNMFHDMEYDHEFDIHTIIGNHDTYYKNTNTPNTPTTFLSDTVVISENFMNVTTTSDFGDHGIDLIGWLNEENTLEILENVRQSSAKICIGHFEFVGFEMNKGYVTEHGTDSKSFSKYEMVISGHYHTKSKKDNVWYVGTPYQLSWGDYGDTKGFWVLDDEAMTMTFIQNPVEFFVKIEYEDNMNLDMTTLQNKWVRMTVKNKTNQEKYDEFVRKIHEHQPAELKIVEDLVKHNESYKIENADISNALTIMRNYVSQTTFSNIDSEIVFNKLQEYYNKALLIK